MTPAKGLIGQQFANFRILRMLGRGGMAEVYYGWDVKLQRPVAIKVIDARYREDPVYARRFVNEARSMAAWHHPNIIQIYYSDDQDGYYYYVMEYIHGMDLERVMAEYRRRQELAPVEDVVWVGRAAAAALDYAHRNGVVHRDVKPSNLLISADSRIVLTDFGLAMNVEQGSLGMVFGSPQYIAPEQARHSSAAVPQSDLYSLGVILYEALTGALPFDDPSPTSLALHHLMMEPPSPRYVNPRLNPAVEDVLLKALRKAPEERYPSGAALMDALEAALAIPEQTASFIPHDQARVEQTAAWSPRRISQTPLAEVVANHLRAQPGLSLGDDLSQAGPAPIPARRWRSLPWWRIGCGALVIIGLLVFSMAALAFNRLEANRQTTFTAQAIVTNAVAGSFSKPTATDPVPTDRPVTATPGLPTSSLTLAPEPTETVMEPPSPTAVPPTDTPEPAPPPKPGARPKGDRFELYYDDTSFYIKNVSGKERSIFPLAFERLDQKGNPSSSRFEGWRWGNIYPKFRNGYCLVLEILDYTRHLNPPECKNLYLVIRTPTKDQDYLFWIKEKNSKEFRVLWNDEEAGRCKISAGVCEVYLP